MAASTQRYPGWPISPQHAHMHQGFFAPASPCLVACASWQQQHNGGWINPLFPMQAHPQPTFAPPAMQIIQPQWQHLKTAAPSPRGPSKQRSSLSASTPESTARKDPGALPTVARPKPQLTTRSSLSFSVTKIPAGIMKISPLMQISVFVCYYGRCRSALLGTYSPLIFFFCFLL